MDVALVTMLSGMDNDSMDRLADVYARWARQIRALTRYEREHEQWDRRWRAGEFLSAEEKRYCEAEGIPPAEFFKSKHG